MPPFPPVLPPAPPAPADAEAEVEPPVGVKVAACHTDGTWQLSLLGEVVCVGGGLSKVYLYFTNISTFKILLRLPMSLLFLDERSSSLKCSASCQNSIGGWLLGSL